MRHSPNLPSSQRKAFMKQRFNKTLLTLLFLLPICQVVFGATNEVGEPDALTECYPHQTTTFFQPPIPQDYPICDGAITPTDRATFEADTGKVILPAVRVNQKAGYVYSLELSLLSAADDPMLTFEITHYCLIQEPSDLPSRTNIATLTLPPGQIHIPAIEIGGITYSASLEVEQPSTQVWEESEIFTRKKEHILFRVARRDIRQEVEKPKYPVLLVHGSNSDGKTWKKYYKPDSGWWTSKGLQYGGNIYIRDKYHLFEPGKDAENLFPNRLRRSDYLSFFEIKVDKEQGRDELTGDFYTMNFSNNKDISIAAQGLQLKAIVNKISEWRKTEGVYIVAHDLGGVAAKAYLHFYNDEKVKGLITIAMPHDYEDQELLDEFVSSYQGKEAVISLSDTDKRNLTSNSAIENEVWNQLISW